MAKEMVDKSHEAEDVMIEARVSETKEERTFSSLMTAWWTITKKRYLPRLKQAQRDIQVEAKRLRYDVWFFGSVETHLSASSSDVDVLIDLGNRQIGEAIKDWTDIWYMKDFNRTAALVKKKCGQPMIVLRHYNGTKCDIVFSSYITPRNELRLNTNLLRVFGELGHSYGVAYVMIRELFEGTPVFQSNMGGISHYALAILMQAICLRENYICHMNIESGNMIENEKKKVRKGELVLKTLSYLGDLASSRVDLREDNPVTASESCCIIDPYTRCDLTKESDLGVEILREKLSERWRKIIETKPKEWAREREHHRTVVVPLWKELPTEKRKYGRYVEEEILLI